MLKPCQLYQGAMVSTQQKALASLSSAPTTTHTVAQTELWWDCAASQLSAAGCALLLGQSWWQQHEYSCGTCVLWARAAAGVSELTAPLSNIYLHKGEIPADWTMANVTLIYTKTWKEDLGNYRSVSLTSVLGKVMEQIIWSAITWHIQNGHGIMPT